MRVIAAVVAGLLAVSCTGAEPEENTRSRTGSEPKSDAPQVKAQDPVEKIDTPATWCPDIGMPCSSDRVPPKMERASQDLVAELEQDKPSWLRYVSAVHSFDDDYAQINTGIMDDKAGKAMGRTICLSLLQRYVNEAVVLGVRYLDVPHMGSAQLAECAAGTFLEHSDEKRRVMARRGA